LLVFFDVLVFFYWRTFVILFNIFGFMFFI